MLHRVSTHAPLVFLVAPGVMVLTALAARSTGEMAAVPLEPRILGTWCPRLFTRGRRQVLTRSRGSELQLARREPSGLQGTRVLMRGHRRVAAGCLGLALAVGERHITASRRIPRLIFARGMTASGTSGPRVLGGSQRPPEGLRRGIDVLLGELVRTLGRHARQLGQRAPDETRPYRRRASYQRTLPLAFSEHLPHQLPHSPAALFFRDVLRMPVQEGEAEERGLAQRGPGQHLPEGEEARAEAPMPAFRELELDACDVADLPLGEVAHRQGEAALAAILAVEGAHRHAGDAGQLLGPDIVVAPLSQQPRRLNHRRAEEVLPCPHAPPLPPASRPVE